MIIQNAVTCLGCGDFIVSKHRHDFVTCTCGSISVDGGQAYLRRVGDFTNAVDHSWELPDELYRQCADAVEEAIDTNRNKFGIANAVLRRLRAVARIVADGEQRIIACNTEHDEIMIEEADGTFNRYRKVTDVVE
jgi:NADPH-dependent curcumin reductase CurA